MYSRACSVHCQTYWRSFIPVRVSIPRLYPEAVFDGFFLDSDGGQADAARQSKAEMLTTNASVPDDHEGFAKEGFAELWSIPRPRAEVASDLEGFADGNPEPYSTFNSTDSPEGGLLFSGSGLSLGWSRVVTLEYEHHDAWHQAMNNLMRPEHRVGSATPCYYDPGWDGTSAVIQSSQLAFEDEMGYTMWLWLLVTLLAGASAGLAYRVRSADMTMEKEMY